MKVLVLGAGKMTEAILTGLKKSEDLSQWMIYSPSGTSAKVLAGKVGAKVVTDLSSVETPDWVLVGCKPQQLKELKTNLNNRFQKELFVSMLAAVSEEDQRQILGVNELIRIMPNLPVEFNSGVTLLSSTSGSKRLSSFESLFKKLGTALVVSEEELEELTLLTGSGPAFFYEFSRNLAQGFQSRSIEEREKLARDVLLGAALAAKSSQKSLEEMTNAVTSKAGVTIAVLEKWRESKFVDFVRQGIHAGKKRSQEIRDSLRK